MTLTISFYGRSSSPFFLPSTTVVRTASYCFPFDLNTYFDSTYSAPLTASWATNLSSTVSFFLNQLPNAKKNAVSCRVLGMVCSD